MDCSVRKKDGGIIKLESFKEFKLKNEVVIGIFQGSYGNAPELDILIKYQKLDGRVRTPKHIHWAIDLLIKKEHNPKLTKEFAKYLSEMWDKITSFQTKEEQQKCELKFTASAKLKKFEPLNKYGEYSVEFIGHIVELFMIEEKTGNHEAFMFKKLLDAIYTGKDIFSVVSTASFRGQLR